MGAEPYCCGRSESLWAMPCHAMPCHATAYAPSVRPDSLTHAGPYEPQWPCHAVRPYLLNDRAAVQHDNTVGIPNRRQSMRDQHRRAPLHQRLTVSQTSAQYTADDAAVRRKPQHCMRRDVRGPLVMARTGLRVRACVRACVRARACVRVRARACVRVHVRA